VVQSGIKWFNDMLIGEYQHALDPKGRVILPSRFRGDLGEAYIITKGLDRCISVYGREEWYTIEEKIKALPNAKSRSLKRFLFASASEAVPDKNGRILIPPNLREYAGISRELVITGALTCVEIWDKEKWDKICSELTPETVAGAMDELGF
jgi:MraZ protein